MLRIIQLIFCLIGYTLCVELVTKCCNNDTFELQLIHNNYLCHFNGQYHEPQIKCKFDANLTAHFQITDLIDDPEYSCLAHFDGRQIAYICLDESISPPILILLSIFFLFVTIFIYFYYQELRKLLLVKCILSSLVSLTISFLLLSSMTIMPKVMCSFRGYLMYFWLMCTFFWQNIISFHIWKMSMNIKWRFTNKQIYTLYSIYAWLIPSLLVIFTIAVQHTQHNLNIVKPDIGQVSCWFNGVQENWVYFLGPMTLVQLCNILLFIWSCYNYYTANRQQNRKLQLIFTFYLRLFIVMGLLWINEVFSFVFNHLNLYIFEILDNINRLQGVWIFIVLCIRKPVLLLIFPKFFQGQNDDSLENISVDQIE